MIERRYIFISSALVVLMLFFGRHASLAQETALQDSVNISLADSAEIYHSDTVNALIVADTLATDTIPAKKFLSGVELKIDYGKLLTLWTEFESKYEAGINIRFYERIVLNTEFGFSELNPLKAYDNALYYTITGMYGRVGFDYYTTYTTGNFYFVGLRYGMSTFEDEGEFLLESEYWPDYEEGFGSQDVSASWIEFVLGTETYLKISKQSKTSGKSRFLLGWNARLRFLTDFENREEPRIYAIPGYGRTFNNVAAALNFYIKYRIGS
jgi:hypothetical protein